jgi:NADP-dependent 3-hydroxy acid dehydrogenase YdfG
LKESLLQFPNLASRYPKKRAIITGAGSGIGYAFTNFLVKDGWHICAIDLNVFNLQSLICDLLSINQVDVTNQSHFKVVISEFCLENNGVDILFNNAGVGDGGFFVDYSLENWDWIIDINLKAVIQGTYCVLPFMLKENAGTIVNMASMAGIANLPKMSPYNVTKAGVISLSETLNHELYKTNIGLVCVQPTFFQSSIMQHSKGDPTIIASAEKKVKQSVLTSEDAARIILKDLHKQKQVVRFPFSAHVFYFSRRYMSIIYKFTIRRLLLKS